MTLENRMRALIRDNRRSRWARTAAKSAERFLNAWHNTGFYDFDRNGEAFVLRTLARVVGGARLMVWDVGAHGGDYAEAVHAILPDAFVTSFEILPPIADRLRSRNLDPRWFVLRNIGLSDAEGVVPVTWNHRHDTTSSVQPRHGSDWFDHGETEVIACEVSTVDLQITGGMRAPDILKIDVEGHEAAVLDGSAGLLRSEQAPMLIQFEYGDTWIPASRTLHDAQGKLERAGYAVGRLYPDHVEFKRYAFTDERFRMGNMIAVRRDDLRRALA